MSDENVVSLTGAWKVYLRPAHDDEYWDRLEVAHEQEAVRNRAEFYNFGWYTDDDSIMSKTDKGYLTSVLCRATGKFQHYWEPYRQ